MSISKMVECTADQIQKDQAEVEQLRLHIKDLYARINDNLATTNGIITKDIENLYKEIDSTFNKKSKVEQKIQAAKRKIFADLGIN